MYTLRHSIRDSFVWFVSYSGITWLYRKRAAARGALVRVIAFHDVRDLAWFEQVVKILVAQYNVITPDQFHNREFDQTRINILITFDDGYASWVTHCLPVLAQYKVKAVFFVISRLLEIANNTAVVKKFMRQRLCLSQRTALSWEDVGKLVKAGHVIGGHTVTHPVLAQLSKEEAAEEIRVNRSDILAKLGVSPADFAYPFGRTQDYTHETTAIAAACGYRYVYHAEPGFAGRDMLHIPRTLIEEGQSPRSVRQWIDGGYDLFHAIKR